MERRWGENAGGVAPADQLQLGRVQEMLQVSELGPAGIDGQITAPEQAFDSDRLEARLEHAAVHSAAGEIHEDIGQVAHGRERVDPVAAAADVGQQEVDLGVPRGQRAELGRVGGLLPRVVPPPVLPDVVQHGHASLGATRQIGSSSGSLARRLAASLMPIMPASRQRRSSASAWARKLGLTTQ